jgi:hypothetical protein
MKAVIPAAGSGQRIGGDGDDSQAASPRFGGRRFLTPHSASLRPRGSKGRP